MSDQKQTHVSEAKKKVVGDLTELIKSKKTILVASIKDIPASQFQEISKKLRGRAVVKVPKKNLIFRAIDDSGKETVVELKDKIKDSVAILFSDVDAFELAGDLVNNKSVVKAKAGQIAPEDITIPAGPTELLPGPAISELGAVGLQVQIENGKITIRESKVVSKEGEVISAGAADVMAKLDIKPFSVGFVPLVAFDSEANKIYTEMKIDKDEAVEELKIAFGRALPFAVEIGYSTPETISFLIGKAGMHGKALEKFAGAEKEEKADEAKEEVNEETPSETSESEASEEKADNKENAADEKPENQDNNPENPEPAGEVNAPEDKSDGEENK
jgi:large subunit ribosomal protein L10